jgi:predicted N-acetyltransferase YhbS
MEVRTARPDEYPALGDLTVVAYEQLEPGRLGDYADELRDVAGRTDGVEILVAADGGHVLGGVSYVPGPDSPAAEFDDPDAAGIRMLAVAGDARRRGVGEALTRACIDRARVSGRGQIVLHSTDRMVDAHRLYVRLGFERDPSIDWEPEPDLWLRGFRLRISPAR